MEFSSITSHLIFSLLGTYPQLTLYIEGRLDQTNLKEITMESPKGNRLTLLKSVTQNLPYVKIGEISYSHDKGQDIILAD